VEQRGKLRAAPVARCELEPVGDRDDEIDNVTAVSAGVLVVGFDDVAEQHGCSAVRGGELERVVDPPLTLAGERRKEQQHRQHEQERPGTPIRAERDEEAERREHRVHRERRQN
jgi:hypothetical protein